MARRPIVLLHGVLDSPDVWARVAPLLEGAGWKVILDDARDDDNSIEHAERLAEELPPAGAHLVGHSRGGTAASWIAVDEPDLARSLAIVASPPQASEAFRATFRKRVDRAGSDDERAALSYLSAIPDEDFPQHALRRYGGPALVVEYEDDPLYSPTHTMFWRMFLPYAAFERVPGGHRAFAEDDAAAEWLAERVVKHAEAAEGHSP